MQHQAAATEASRKQRLGRDWHLGLRMVQMEGIQMSWHSFDICLFLRACFAGQHLKMIAQFGELYSTNQLVRTTRLRFQLKLS